MLLAPGLSVIVHTIRVGREIFARMTSYAIYRIAETVRVLLFVTAAILAFDLFPVTTIMIVLLALLNDGAILAIAYDHGHRGAESTARWQMRTVLTVATVLGVLGVVASFGLLRHRARRPRATAPTWPARSCTSSSPSPGTSRSSSPAPAGPSGRTGPLPDPARRRARHPGRGHALRGLRNLHDPDPPGPTALLVWGYALGWFLEFNDQVKLATYRYLDRGHEREAVVA